MASYTVTTVYQDPVEAHDALTNFLNEAGDQSITPEILTKYNIVKTEASRAEHQPADVIEFSNCGNLAFCEERSQVVFAQAGDEQRILCLGEKAGNDRRFKSTVLDQEGAIKKQQCRGITDLEVAILNKAVDFLGGSRTVKIKTRVAVSRRCKR
jgi:hypothetical protein